MIFREEFATAFPAAIANYFSTNPSVSHLPSNVPENIPQPPERLPLPDDRFSSDSAAQFLGINKSTLSAHSINGVIPFDKPDGYHRSYKRADLVAHLNKVTQGRVDRGRKQAGRLLDGLARAAASRANQPSGEGYAHVSDEVESR